MKDVVQFPLSKEVIPITSRISYVDFVSVLILNIKNCARCSVIFLPKVSNKWKPNELGRLVVCA